MQVSFAQIATIRSRTMHQSAGGQQKNSQIIRNLQRLIVFVITDAEFPRRLIGTEMCLERRKTLLLPRKTRVEWFSDEYP